MIDWEKKKLVEWQDLGCGGGEYQSNILQNHMENCSIVIMQPEGFQDRSFKDEHKLLHENKTRSDSQDLSPGSPSWEWKDETYWK